MPHGPQIALTPQTDERNFPRWKQNAGPGESGHAYPKMLTRVCTKEDRKEWLEKNRQVDQNTGREYWLDAPPRVGSQIPILTTPAMVDDGLCQLANEPVVVTDRENEERVRMFMHNESTGHIPPAPVEVSLEDLVQVADAPAPAKRKPLPKRRRRIAQRAPEVVSELD